MNQLRRFMSSTTGRVIIITASAVLVETLAEKFVDKAAR